MRTVGLWSADPLIEKALNNVLAPAFKVVQIEHARGGEPMDVCLLDDPTETLLQNVRRHHGPFQGVCLVPSIEEGSTFDAHGMTTLVKPVRGRTLLQVLASLDAPHYSFGAYVLYPSRRVLLHASTSNTLPLTEKETDILAYLITHAGKEITRDQLLADVWGYHPEITTHTLETHLYRLRKKLQQIMGEDILIGGVKGYSMAPAGEEKE